MIDMVDQVAKAIAERRAITAKWEIYRSLAKTAIKAMQEPTFEMLCAGQSCIYIERNENLTGPHVYASREELLEAWEVMIDTALESIK